jgi:hypothetical protein
LELAELYLKAPEVTRRNTRVHFMQPLKERIVPEVGYGLSLEGASAADLVKSMQAKSKPVARKEKSEGHGRARATTANREIKFFRLRLLTCLGA